MREAGGSVSQSPERDGRLEAIPIDKRGWKEPDDSRIPIIAIGVHGDSLVYHAPWMVFASTCLQ